MPKGRESRRWSSVVSMLIHLLIIYLLITPFVVHHPIHEMAQGAGGAEPAGGGGGGSRGSGGQTHRQTEHLDFVSVAPAPTPPPASVRPPTPRLVPVKPAVLPTPHVTPVVVPPSPAIVASALTSLDVSAIAGAGGGSGRDGSAGNGPGRGGGVGSGVGTGRGSGNGPGVGGGSQSNYPPTPIDIFLPPYPIPDNVKGFHLVAEFDVDSTGRVLSMDFTPTPNRGYNRRLSEVFHSFTFRPGTTPEGTPVHMKAQIGFVF